MLLENKYYSIVHTHLSEDGGTFHVAILPECEVYQGHFPGHPVCPGACNIEMIKECAMKLLGKKVHFRGIRQCRLTSVASPGICPEVEIDVRLQSLEDGWSIAARVADEKKTYVELKGELAQ